MITQPATINFFLRQRKYVYCRITMNGTMDEQSVEKLPSGASWDQGMQKIKGRSPEIIDANVKLMVLKNELYKIATKSRGQLITAKDVFAFYTNPVIQEAKPFPNTVKAIFDYYVAEKKKGRGSVNTIDFYEKRRDAVLRFIKETYGQEDISTSQLDRQFFRSYYNYLKPRVSEETAYAYIQAVVTVLDFIISDFPKDLFPDNVSWNPGAKLFKRPKGNNQKSQANYVAVALEEKLWNWKPDPTMEPAHSKSHNLWRNIILWQWNTGWSFADLGHQQYHFSTFENVDFICYYRQKTKEMGMVPVTEPIRKLLTTFTMMGGESLIPINRFVKKDGSIDKKLYTAAYETYRYHLKYFATVLGVDKLTSHMFRHTFGIKLSEMGYSAEFIQRAMAHSSVKTTQSIYVPVTGPKMVKEVIMKAG